MRYDRPVGSLMSKPGLTGGLIVDRSFFLKTAMNGASLVSGSSSFHSDEQCVINQILRRKMTSKYIYLHHNRTHTKTDLQHVLTGIEARYDLCTYFNTIVHRGQQMRIKTGFEFFCSDFDLSINILIMKQIMYLLRL